MAAITVIYSVAIRILPACRVCAVVTIVVIGVIVILVRIRLLVMMGWWRWTILIMATILTIRHDDGLDAVPMQPSVISGRFLRHWQGWGSARERWFVIAQCEDGDQRTGFDR